MTIKTFWLFLLKILGLWLVLEAFTMIPQLVTTLFYTTFFDDADLNLGMSIGLFLLSVGIYISILQLFLFKTHWIIDKLKLDSGLVKTK